MMSLTGVNASNRGGVVVNIDFLKAFDSLNFSFISHALSFFGFKENFIKWVNITQNQFLVCTSNAGNIAAPFSLGKGVKQGCPLSPGLFIISLELLSLKIQHDPSIKGFKLGRYEVRQSFFADDSIFLLSKDETSVKKVIEILDQFAILSGLKINRDKSSLIEFGPSSGAPFCPSIPFARVKKFDYLGFTFTANLDNMEINVDKKLDEIKKMSASWKNRNLSIYGRNIVAKSLMVSKITNILMVVPNLKKKKIDIFERAIYDFLWQGNDAVRRVDAQISEANGGLNFPNISRSIHTFKIAWFRRLFSVDSSWAHIFNELLYKVAKNLSFDNLLKLGDCGWAKIAKRLPSNFWKSCLKAPSNPFREFIKLNPALAFNISVWENSLVLHQGSPFSLRANPSFKNKVSFVFDFIDPTSGNLFTFHSFAAVHGNIDPTHFDNFINSIRSLLTNMRLNLNNIKVERPARPSWLAFFNITTKGCRGWSKLLGAYRTDNIRLREEKWERTLGKRLGPLFWDKTYKNLLSISFNNKLKWFQFTFNRGIIKTNNIICKFVPNQNDRCTFCQAFIEDTVHLFWDCNHTTTFYTSLTQYFNELNIPWPPRSRELFFFGDHVKTFSSDAEYTYLHLKHYVWVSRCLKNALCIAAFKNKLRENILLDLHHFGGWGGEGGRGGINPYQFIRSLADRVGIG